MSERPAKAGPGALCRETARRHKLPSCFLPLLCHSGPIEKPQAALARDGFCYHPSDPTRLPSAAWAAANRAIGKRNGEQDTSSSPTSWQNETEAGSPPCSPQMRLLVAPCGRAWWRCGRAPPRPRGR